MAERWQKTEWIPDLEGGLPQKWKKRIAGLRVNEAAIEDGRLNLPAAGETQLSAKESELVGVFEHGRDLLMDWFRERLTDATDRVRATFPPDFDAQAWVADCRSVVAATIAENRKDLENASLDHDERQRDLNAFRATHRLTRGVQMPNMPKVVLGVGILIFCIALESALNMAFFAHGVGLLQGALYAIAVSATNVGMGVITGMIGIRLAANRMPLLKIVGWLVILVFACGALFANLLYAHAREVSLVSEAGGFNAELALEHLLANPFAIGNSILLFFLGLIVFTVGMLDGRASFTDPYWDYGRFGRLNDAAQRRLDTMIADIREDTERHLADNEKVLNDLNAKARRSAASAQAAVEQARSRRADIEDSCNLLVSLCRQSMGRYRQQNRAVRTADAPTYFANESFPPLPVSAPGIDSLLDLQLEAEKRATWVVAEVQKARAELAEYRENQLQEQLDNAIALARRLKASVAYIDTC